MNKTKLNTLMRFRREGYPHAASHRFGDYFGIELEIENFNRSALAEDFQHWMTHNDGSLQEDGIEFVLASPRGGGRLISALDEYYGRNIVGTNGLRTSTHIHINASDMTVGQVRSMIVMAYTLESALFRWVGENRKWCGYAMPLSEMPSERLRKLLTADTNQAVVKAISATRNNDRYYGLNVASIAKHGSVEFRHFPGMPDRGELESWLDFVLAIKRLAMTMPFPTLGERINSEQELTEFLSSVIPENVWDRLRSVEIVGELWQNFNEVMALAEPDEGVERADALVFYKPPLLRYFVRSKRLTPYQAEQFGKVMEKAQVMTVRDFHTQLTNAMRIALPTQDRAQPAPEPDEPEELEELEERWPPTIPQGLRAGNTQTYDELVSNTTPSFNPDGYRRLMERMEQEARARREQQRSADRPRPTPSRLAMTTEQLDRYYAALSDPNNRPESE